MKLFINTGEANSIKIRLPLKFVSLYGCLRAYYATLALLLFCLVVKRKGKDPPELYIFTIKTFTQGCDKKLVKSCKLLEIYSLGKDTLHIHIYPSINEYELGRKIN